MALEPNAASHRGTGSPCTPVRHACPSPCNTTSAFAATALLQCSFRTRSSSGPRLHSCNEGVVGQPVVWQPGRRTPSPQRGRKTVRSNAHPRPPPVSMRVVGSRVSTRGERLDRPRGCLGRGRTRNKSGGDSKTRCEYAPFTSVAVRYCRLLSEDGLGSEEVDAVRLSPLVYRGTPVRAVHCQ